MVRSDFFTPNYDFWVDRWAMEHVKIIIWGGENVSIPSDRARLVVLEQTLEPVWNTFLGESPVELLKSGAL